MYSKIEFNSIACAKISTKTSNTRLCAYRCVEGWRKHLKLGGDIHKTYTIICVFNIHILLYCAFGGHLKALHLLAILGGDFALFSGKFDGGDATPNVPTRSAAPGCMLQVMCSGVT